MVIIDNIKKALNWIKTPSKEPKVFNQLGSGISGYTGNSGYSEYGSGAKFTAGMSRYGSVTIHEHFTIRQHARDAMYDSNIAKSMVDRYADTVVDTGLKLKPVPIPEILGIDSEILEQWAEDTAQKFHLWAKSKKSHRSRINNFYQNQRLYQIFQQRDNDIFVRFFYGRNKDLINKLQIDYIDPNQIRGYGYTSTYYQTNYEDGIIRDNDNREIGYKIWNFDPSTNGYKDKTIPAAGEKSGRIMMIHGFNPEYAGQGRGFSRIAHVLQEFEQLTDFKQSVIQKAINQSSFIAAIENAQQDASNPMEGRVAGPIRQYGSDPEPSADAQNVEIEPIINYTQMPEATITTPGSTLIANLKQGDKINYLKDTSPSAEFDSFVNAFCSYLAASNGMPVEVLLMKFNQNYSASRGALILFWQVVKIWRHEMEADFLNPVYEMWLSEEIAAGRIQCPGWSDYRLREAWLNTEWAGIPMPNIDPKKTMDADKGYVEMSAQTLDDVARNLNGSSGKANRIKNKRQFAELPGSPFTESQNNIDIEEEEDKE
jgi:lambda family phage portal protein